MSTFNCCRGRAARIAACNTPSSTAAPVETAVPVSMIKPDSFFRRAGRSIKPLLPAFLLAIVPKCPFCLAAYVALGTGIGLSVTSARLLHISLLCAGLIPLSLFAAKHIRDHFFPVPFAGWHPQVFTGMAGILIGSSILWLF
ncbi:hypothetical protein [Chitinophaga sp. S165]|uniref:hypothetical protein n=1 Tax=Chitinophaga sp. S165 TaxID=2135462 RepID=UPI000D71A162|nr:hypothetical protein [Chitinophaga sp. S165]